MLLSACPSTREPSDRPGVRFGLDAHQDTPRAYAYSDFFARGEEADGFFSIDAGGELLRGVTMADCGNTTVVPSDISGNLDKLTMSGVGSCEHSANGGQRSSAGRTGW